MNLIEKKRAQIEHRLAAAQSDLATLQMCCPHGVVKRIAKADTGNWSRSDDRYWVDCECLDCGKRWQEDQ